MFCAKCGNIQKPTDKFCDNCGLKNEASLTYLSVQEFEASDAKIALIKKIQPLNNTIILALILFLIVGGVSYALYTNNVENEKVVAESLERDRLKLELETIEEQKQSNLKAIVNIVCDNDGGGSGTIISKDGLVLTNHHVVEGASNCLITLPDTMTGTPISIYSSEPIIVPKLSEEYDIAMLNINSSYTDSDGETWGEYPTDFPTYIRPDICDDTTLKLGDSLKIYGYPVTSGGYNLTVTEGIISSFSEDGNILTSAKIDSGNSGGFSVDANGCFVGIPTAVIEGQFQNFGVIISGDIITNFIGLIPPSETFEKNLEDVTPQQQGYKNELLDTTSNVEELRVVCEQEVQETFELVDTLANSDPSYTKEQVQAIARQAGITDEDNYVIDEEILINQCINSKKIN